ncbi:hypothetical protein Tco_1182805 [Tanacetum coccineum]
MWVSNDVKLVLSFTGSPQWGSPTQIYIFTTFRAAASITTEEINGGGLWSSFDEVLVSLAAAAEMEQKKAIDYARALIEMPFENVPVDSLVVAISFNDGPGHTMETIDVEYEWQPSRCVTCKTFGRNNDQCPKKTKVAGLDQVLGDGLVEVTRKQGKGKQHTKPKQIGGIWLTKLKLNYFYRPISTYANDHGEASTSLPKGHVDAVDTQI